MDWDDETLKILNKIRLNSIFLSEKHRRKFFLYKSVNNYFDIPIIVLSVFASSFAVGSQSYIEQELISLISCGISILITIISSIKIYLNLDNILKNELEMSKAFYLLSIDIYKTLHVLPEKRQSKALDYLNDIYVKYSKLYEKSHLLKKRFKSDMLIDLPDNLYFSDESSVASLGSSTPSTPKLTKKNIELIKQTIQPINSVNETTIHMPMVSNNDENV